MNIYFQKNHQRSFGTYPLKQDDLRQALLSAIKTGYRAIDTAQMYENEAETGETIANCGIDREEFCITTKIHPDNFSEEKFMPSLEESLKKLRVSATDVLLLHWPDKSGNNETSLKLLAKAKKEGLARHIGISNYNVQMMRDAKALLDEALVTNQVEFHPLLNQDKLLAATFETGIPLSSYCSVARGEVFKDPDFATIGETYGKTAGQIVLRWILQKGVSINTMSTKPANIQANFNVMDFTLSSTDMARIEAKTAKGFRIVNSDLVPWAPVWD